MSDDSAPATSIPTRTGRRGPALGTWAPPVLVALVVIGIWYLISSLLGKKNFLLPPPHEVIIKGFLDPATASDIFTALGRSALVALVGLGIAITSVITSGMQQILCGQVQRKHSMTSNQLLSNTAPVQVRHFCSEDLWGYILSKEQRRDRLCICAVPRHLAQPPS